METIAKEQKRHRKSLETLQAECREELKFKQKSRTERRMELHKAFSRLLEAEKKVRHLEIDLGLDPQVRVNLQLGVKIEELEKVIAGIEEKK